MAQVALRWNIERGVIIIPKSVSEDRISENLDIWNFSLSFQDMQDIAALDKEHSEIVNHFDPEFVKYLHRAKF